MQARNWVKFGKSQDITSFKANILSMPTVLSLLALVNFYA